MLHLILIILLINVNQSVNSQLQGTGNRKYNIDEIRNFFNLKPRIYYKALEQNSNEDPKKIIVRQNVNTFNNNGRVLSIPDKEVLDLEANNYILVKFDENNEVSLGKISLYLDDKYYSTSVPSYSKNNTTDGIKQNDEKVKGNINKFSTLNKINNVSKIKDNAEASQAEVGLESSAIYTKRKDEISIESEQNKLENRTDEINAIQELILLTSDIKNKKLKQLTEAIDYEINQDLVSSVTIKKSKPGENLNFDCDTKADDFPNEIDLDQDVLDVDDTKYLEHDDHDNNENEITDKLEKQNNTGVKEKDETVNLDDNLDVVMEFKQDIEKRIARYDDQDMYIEVSYGETGLVKQMKDINSVKVLQADIGIGSSHYEVTNYHELIGIPEAERVKELEDYPEPTKLIINGTQAELGDFPYLGGLIIRLPTGRTSICGSSLISPRHALTAGHCGMDSRNVASHIEVVFASLKIFHGGLRMQAQKVVLHPDYHPKLLLNDIAILWIPRIKKPEAFSKYIDTIDLPSGSLMTENLTGRSVYVAGYGKTRDSQPISLKQTLNFRKVKIANNKLCRDIFGPKVVTRNHYCSNGTLGGTCAGDSGGPMVYYDEYDNPILVGITSFGSPRGCKKRSPLGFTRVACYKRWVLRQIKKHRGKKSHDYGYDDDFEPYLRSYIEESFTIWKEKVNITVKDENNFILKDAMKKRMVEL